MSMRDWFTFKRAVPTTTFALLPQSQPTMSPRDYKGFSQESFQKNVIAFRCIDKIGEAMAGIHLNLKKRSTKSNDEIVYDHPVLDLLKHPNPLQPYQSFVKSAFGYFMIAGNSYVQAVRNGLNNDGDTIMQLVTLRPDRIKIAPGPRGIPTEFIYKTQEVTTHYPVNQVDGSSSIMQMKTFHPMNDWFGMSPIEAAAFSVDQFNAMGKWNLALLQNSARPSGALVMAQTSYNPTGTLNDKQLASMKTEIKERWAGAENAGEPLLLQGGMDWKPMGFTPTDLDWIEGKHTTARDVALAFGVPPQLLGIPGDNTYSNYEQAKLAFYIDTVLPLHYFWCEHLNIWLLPAFEEGMYLCPDEQAIVALEPLRREKWTQVNGATFLSYNEKREQLGYGRYMPSDDAADKIFVTGNLIPLELAAEGGVDAMLADPAAGDNSDYVGDTGGSADAKPNPDDQTDNTDTGKQIDVYFDGKALNLRTERAKQRYLRQIGRARSHMGARFSAQLKAFWKKEAKLVADAVDDIDQTLIDSTVDAVLDETSKTLLRIFRSNIERAMRFFGADVLALAKSWPQYGMETKDSDTRFESFLHHYIETHSAERVKITQRTTKKKVVTKLRETFHESLASGATPDEIITQVKDIYEGFTAARSATIVRTEIGIASSEAHRAAAKSLGIAGLEKMWISEMVDRSRQFDRDSTDHTAMHNMSIPMMDKFMVPSEDGADDMEGPGDPNAPADQVINCVLPDAKISGNIIGAMRSKYVGPAIELHTASGKVLSVTPNHPVFTVDGLVPAGEIHKGMHLLANGWEVNKHVSMPNDNVKQQPSVIQDIFHAFENLCFPMRRYLSSDDFHGDARFIKGQVDIVGSDRFLWLKDQSAFFEHFKKLSFESKYPESTFLNHLSSGCFSSETIDASAPGGPGIAEHGIGPSDSLFGRNPPVALSIGSIAKDDSFLFELCSQVSSVDIQTFRNTQQRFSSQMFGDRVVQIVTKDFDGHVYDLSSTSGAYVANGIIIHNCHCVQVFNTPGSKR